MLCIMYNTEADRLFMLTNVSYGKRIINLYPYPLTEHASESAELTQLGNLFHYCSI